MVAIDMPLSRKPIVARRASDDSVSKAYGARKAGTHTPKATRPGSISDALQRDFASAGYPLCTEALAVPGLIEVYPHPALIELAGAAERLPYKVGKIRKYWPTVPIQERRRKLFQQWATIVRLLEGKLDGVEAALPALDPAATTAELKAYEDKLDAVVCAWVAVCALEGRARPFGDAESAIWIPVREDAALACT